MMTPGGQRMHAPIYQCKYPGCGKAFVHETSTRRHERDVHKFYRGRGPSEPTAKTLQYGTSLSNIQIDATGYNAGDTPTEEVKITPNDNVEDKPKDSIHETPSDNDEVTEMPNDRVEESVNGLNSIKVVLEEEEPECDDNEGGTE